jgi:hypothetical protein
MRKDIGQGQKNKLYTTGVHTVVLFSDGQLLKKKYIYVWRKQTQFNIEKYRQPPKNKLSSKIFPQ